MNVTLRALFVVVSVVAVLPCRAMADRIIMKDGKIYEGHIMGETQDKILITTPLGEPRFVQVRDALTVIRQDHAFGPSSEPQRYFSGEGDLGGAFFTSRELQFPPSLIFRGAVGFRLHPLFEVGTDFDWIPQTSGALSIIDGQRLRGYEKFWMARGGFWSRLYPFAKLHWITEPYLMGGYQWDRLVPKGSEDYLSGRTWRIGVGCQRVLRGSLYGNAQVLYNHTSFDSVEFNNSSGDLANSISNNHVTSSIGVSYHVD